MAFCTTVANIDIGTFTLIQHVGEILGRHYSRSLTVEIVLRHN